MDFLDVQLDMMGFCYLTHLVINDDKQKPMSFTISKYTAIDHENAETTLMIDDIEDAHNKCIDMILKNSEIFVRDDMNEPSIHHLIVIGNQPAIKSRRGVGNIIICNKNDMITFVELKLSNIRNYTFMVSEKIPAGYLLSIYKGTSLYDSIGAVFNNEEESQLWLKLQDNYLDYCCLATFDFSRDVLPKE